MCFDRAVIHADVEKGVDQVSELLGFGSLVYLPYALKMGKSHHCRVLDHIYTLMESDCRLYHLHGTDGT